MSRRCVLQGGSGQLPPLDELVARRRVLVNGDLPLFFDELVAPESALDELAAPEAALDDELAVPGASMSLPTDAPPQSPSCALSHSGSSSSASNNSFASISRCVFAPWGLGLHFGHPADVAIPELQTQIIGPPDLVSRFLATPGSPQT